jgi:hypothetical protein
MWNLIFIHLETVLVSVQDRCMVCAKRTVGLEIVLVASNDAPRCQGSSGSSIQSIWR